MTLEISEVLDNKIKSLLKGENDKFIAFIEKLGITLEELEADTQYYIDLYEEDSEEKKRLIAILFLFAVSDLLANIEKELRRLGLYSETLINQISADITANTSGILKQFESEISDKIKDTYDRVLKAVLANLKEIKDIEEFLKKYRKIVDNFSDFHSIQLNNIVFSALENKFFDRLGLTVFIWGTQMDNRVRDTHNEREGNYFYTDGKPADGNSYSDGKEIVPKQEYNCRCYKIIADVEFVSAIIKRHLGGMTTWN